MGFVKATKKQIGYRFWARVQKGDEDECWLWLGRPDKDGYGIIRVDGKKTRAHVASYRMAKGATNGLQVCHSCDNRRCVNPSHLFLGTHKENIADRHSKSRDARLPGEANGRAKLTSTQVSEIRLRAASGEPKTRIAKSFGVSDVAIGHIVSGRNWSSIK